MMHLITISLTGRLQQLFAYRTITFNIHFNQGKKMIRTLSGVTIVAGPFTLGHIMRINVH